MSESELTGEDRTGDGVLITEGLRVWTNDMERGVISLDRARYETNPFTCQKKLWFHVVRDRDGFAATQSSDRVATRLKGEPA